MKKCPVCKRNIQEKKNGVLKCLCGYTEVTASLEENKSINKSFKEFCKKCDDCKFNDYSIDRGSCRELYAESLLNNGKIVIDISKELKR